MPLDEAKGFFFQYHGFQFHMYREYVNRYNLKISDEILEKWRCEILDNDLKCIKNHCLENQWIIICNYILLYWCIKTRIDEYSKNLFTLIDYAREKLDPKQKILIMEELAGRDINLSGGIKSICKKTKLKQELRVHIDGLKEFNPNTIRM